MWVAQPDGSSARPITTAAAISRPPRPTTAPSSPSAAPASCGSIAPAATLATLNSVMTGAPAGINAVGPFDPVISPDGTKLAYWIGMYSSGTTTATTSSGTAPGR